MSPSIPISLLAAREVDKPFPLISLFDTGLPNKNLGVDHAFDAFGYLCLQQFNLVKPETLGQTGFRIY